MYKKAFKLIVLLNKPVAFFFWTFSLPSLSSLLKLPIIGTPMGKYNFDVVPGCRVGAFAPYFKAPPWSFCMKRPALINVGHLQLFQIKMTNARGEVRGWQAWN